MEKNNTSYKFTDYIKKDKNREYVYRKYRKYDKELKRTVFIKTEYLGLLKGWDSQGKPIAEKKYARGDKPEIKILSFWDYIIERIEDDKDKSKLLKYIKILKTGVIPKDYQPEYHEKPSIKLPEKTIYYNYQSKKGSFNYELVFNYPEGYLKDIYISKTRVVKNDDQNRITVYIHNLSPSWKLITNIQKNKITGKHIAFLSTKILKESYPPHLFNNRSLNVRDNNKELLLRLEEESITIISNCEINISTCYLIYRYLNYTKALTEYIEQKMEDNYNNFIIRSKVPEVLLLLSNYLDGLFKDKVITFENLQIVLKEFLLHGSIMKIGGDCYIILTNQVKTLPWTNT